MYQRITMSQAFSSTDTDLTVSMSLPHVNQKVAVIVVDIPTWTNTVTASIFYKTDGAKTLWTVAGLAKTTTTPYAVELPLIEDLAIRILLSGAAGGSGGTVTVYLYVDET